MCQGKNRQISCSFFSRIKGLKRLWNINVKLAGGVHRSRFRYAAMICLGALSSSRTSVLGERVVADERLGSKGRVGLTGLVYWEGSVANSEGISIGTQKVKSFCWLNRRFSLSWMILRRKIAQKQPKLTISAIKVHLRKVVEYNIRTYINIYSYI